MHPFSHKFTNIHFYASGQMSSMRMQRELLSAKLYHVDLKRLVVRPMSPEKFNGNDSLSEFSRA